MPGRQPGAPAAAVSAGPTLAHLWGLSHGPRPGGNALHFVSTARNTSSAAGPARAHDTRHLARIPRTAYTSPAPLLACPQANSVPTAAARPALPEPARVRRRRAPPHARMGPSAAIQPPGSLAHREWPPAWAAPRVRTWPAAPSCLGAHQPPAHPAPAVCIRPAHAPLNQTAPRPPGAPCRGRAQARGVRGGATPLVAAAFKLAPPARAPTEAACMHTRTICRPSKPSPPRVAAGKLRPTATTAPHTCLRNASHPVDHPSFKFTPMPAAHRPLIAWPCLSGRAQSGGCMPLYGRAPALHLCPLDISICVHWFGADLSQRRGWQAGMSRLPLRLHPQSKASVRHAGRGGVGRGRAGQGGAPWFVKGAGGSGCATTNSRRRLQRAGGGCAGRWAARLLHRARRSAHPTPTDCTQQWRQMHGRRWRAPVPTRRGRAAVQYGQTASVVPAAADSGLCGFAWQEVPLAS
jgi:hypothetical protein